MIVLKLVIKTKIKIMQLKNYKPNVIGLNPKPKNKKTIVIIPNILNFFRQSF
jgi:hypothetical protein